MNFGDEQLPERFWDKISPCPMTGCWIWTGGLHNERGYGSFRAVGRKKRRAHLVAYEALVGPVPSGLELDHRCSVRCCVNPDHLEPVTHLENVRRGRAGVKQAARTHCPQGHPYDEANTIRRSTRRQANHRLCRACRDARMRAWRERKKAA